MGVLTQLGVGHIFAREYRIIAPLAEGGMGAVYIAEQMSTGRKRALKVMLPQLVADARARERFTQEARMGSHIESEHVVEIVGAGVDEPTGMPWLSMELLEGQDLNAAIKQRGPLPMSEAYEIVQQLGEGLGMAHARGIVHRDLKPENLFITVSRRRGVPFTLKILDFGIAKLTQESRTGASTTAAVGSPMWMAPEQTEQHAHLRPSTDVWALGLVVFHMLTGRFYWRVANQPEVRLTALFTEVLVGALEPPSMRAAEMGVAHLLPPGFDAWFVRCVERDPERRFPDARTAVAALTPQFGLRDGAHVAVPPTLEQPQVRRGVSPTMPMAHGPQGELAQLPQGYPPHAQSSQPYGAQAQVPPTDAHAAMSQPYGASAPYPPVSHPPAPHASASYSGANPYASSPSANPYASSPGANPYASSPGAYAAGSMPHAPLPHQGTTPYAVGGAPRPAPAGRGALYAGLALVLLVGTGLSAFGVLTLYQSLSAHPATRPETARRPETTVASAADAGAPLDAASGELDAGEAEEAVAVVGVDPPSEAEESAPAPRAARAARGRDTSPRGRDTSPREAPAEAEAAPSSAAFSWPDGTVRRWRGTWSAGGWRYALTFELNRNGMQVTGTVLWRLLQAGDATGTGREGSTASEWVNGTFSPSGALDLAGYGSSDPSLIQPDHWRLRIATTGGGLSGVTVSDSGRVSARLVE